ncbi:MAG: hypothetical protein R3C59_23235 [Planctomycetaceae bacterium]
MSSGLGCGRRRIVPHLVDYSYLGLRTFVETDYTEPDVNTLVGCGAMTRTRGDIYHGLDRFRTVDDSYWYDYGSSAKS